MTTHAVRRRNIPADTAQLRIMTHDPGTIDGYLVVWASTVNGGSVFLGNTGAANLQAGDINCDNLSATVAVSAPVMLVDEEIRFTPRDAPPGAANMGHVYFDDGTSTLSGQPTLRWADANNYRDGATWGAQAQMQWPVSQLTNPTSPSAGWIYWNGTVQKLRWYNGIIWETVEVRDAAGETNEGLQHGITVRSTLPSGGNGTGDNYFDDGSQTYSGLPGWRYYDGSAWADLVSMPAWGSMTIDNSTIQDSSGNDFAGVSGSVRYNVIGRQCNVMVDIDYTGKGTAVAGDAVQLNVVPLGNIGGVSEYTIAPLLHDSNFTYPAGLTTMCVRAGPNPATFFNIFGNGSAAAQTILVSDLPNGGTPLQFSFQYIIDGLP